MYLACLWYESMSGPADLGWQGGRLPPQKFGRHPNNLRSFEVCHPKDSANNSVATPIIWGPPPQRLGPRAGPGFDQNSYNYILYWGQQKVAGITTDQL